MLLWAPLMKDSAIKPWEWFLFGLCRFIFSFLGGFMGKYWDIGKILSYQRNFNFINGERSIGKTYTTEKFFIDKAIKTGKEFVYITRTQDEKRNGIFKEAFSKVISREFPDKEIIFTNEECILKIDEYKRCLGYCIALSEALKIKKRSFPNVYYLMFDEYMLENKGLTRYVNGWKEPELFLSLYHTIDREEDRVICFLLGNNTTFYNPYHMHPAFQIPHIKKGQIWAGENVLFQWAEGTEELREEKANCKFLKMLNDTTYGKYAVKGDYIEDSDEFIEKRSAEARVSFNIEYMGNTYGIWNDMKHGRIYIDTKTDPDCTLNYALTLEDHSENTMLTSTKSISCLNWLSQNFKLGNVRFVSMEVKKMCEGAINLIL